MSDRLSIAITTGILSGIWVFFAYECNLLSWAGFLGCTAYFACPKGGNRGLFICFATLLTGIFWAEVILQGSLLSPNHIQLLGYILTAIVAFCMCIQSVVSLLVFIPGTFIGACATFACSNHIILVLVSLFVGLLFGYAMKNSGLLLAKFSSK